MESFLVQFKDVPIYGLAQIVSRPSKDDVFIDILTVDENRLFGCNCWNKETFRATVDYFEGMIVEDIGEGLYKEAAERAALKAPSEISVKEFVDWFRKAEGIE